MQSRQAPRSVLVTGGSGFVGLAVVNELVKRGHTVLATTTSASAGLPGATNLRWLEWDARAAKLPAVNWSQVEVILHCAVPRAPFAFPAGAEVMFEVTVAATQRLLEVARREGLRRVLALSTGDVLGSKLGPAQEDDVLYEPGSFYGTAKSCAELLLRAYGTLLPTAILRLFHPYGPGGDRFLVNRLVRAVADGREVCIEGNDGILLNPVWIDDLAEGVCAAVESEATGVFHLAGPETVTLRRLLEIAGDVVNRTPLIRSVPRTAVQRHHGAYERSIQLLEYAPRVAVRAGLARLLERRP